MIEHSASPAPNVQAEADALRLGVLQNATNFRANRIQQKNRVLATYNFLRVLESYREGNLCLCVRLLPSGEAHQVNLIFFSIEGAATNSYWPANFRHLTAVSDFSDKWQNSDSETLNVNRDKRGVLLEVGKMVEGPEGVIPSFVGVERAPQRNDFRRQVLDFVESLGNVGTVIAERERKEGTRVESVFNRDGVAELIEAGSKIGDSIEDDTWEYVSKVGVKSKLLNFVDSVGVRLDNEGGELFFLAGGVHLVEPNAQIISVVMSPTERAFRAGE